MLTFAKQLRKEDRPPRKRGKDSRKLYLKRKRIMMKIERIDSRVRELQEVNEADVEPVPHAATRKKPCGVPP